jgi:polyphosphate kinase 2 (PPK2 family)
MTWRIEEAGTETCNKPALIMNYSELFQVKPGSEVRLKKIEKHVEKLDKKLRELQYLLYAENKRSLLICLQALDAAGKDGTICSGLSAG